MINVPLHPIAEDEFAEGWHWYAARSLRSARGFERAVQEALQDIEATPQRWPLEDDRHRICPLKRYPYYLVYREVASGIEVIAVAHSGRRPGYWKGR